MLKSEQRKGMRGEDLALEYLLKKNYRLVARNFHSAGGEIDLIMLDDDILVFIEVKFRKTDPQTALSSISRSKQRKLYETAGVFLSRYPEYESYFTRFDVIVITSNTETSFYHLESAFS
ncbi:MAG: YraN family protein [Candidatus Cloacimonetes bacterium]|nr:YraN family protein [Candidatus Cloacimonadota bacterium]